MTFIFHRNKRDAQKALIMIVFVSLFFGAVIGAMLGTFFTARALSPTYCYYEHGIITDEYTANGFYYIELESAYRNGYVWLIDEPQGTGDRIKLRWCWIPQVENFKIRGAWRE